MNVEELRYYCLSLSDEVKEKFPFQQFKAARDVLAFYISGHIFCYFDINDISHVTVKCPKEDIENLLEQYDCLKYWIGIDATRADDTLVKELVMKSFQIVRQKK